MREAYGTARENIGYAVGVRITNGEAQFYVKFARLFGRPSSEQVAEEVVEPVPVPGEE